MPDTPTEAPLAPRTSVLLVTRDCADSLRRCLAALEASVPREAIEIIVVDNGSRDGTDQLDAGFPGADFLRLPKNFGYTKAANIGIRGAKGDYVLLLPATVEVAPDTIVRLAARLEAEPELGAVCPLPARAYALPTPEQLYGEWKGTPLTEIAVDASEGAVTVGYVRDSAILTRRNFLTGMRNFDQRYGEFGAQLDLCRQLRNAGKKLAILPEVRIGLTDVPPQAEDTVAVADRLNGIAAYAGKYHGFGAALKIRLGAALSSLAGLRFGVLSAIAGGQKIDGDQPGA